MKEDNDLPLDDRIHPKYPNLYITEDKLFSIEYIGCILLFRNPNDYDPIQWYLCLLPVKTSGTQKMISELNVHDHDPVRMKWGSKRDMDRIRNKFTTPRLFHDHNNGAKVRWYEMWKESWLRRELDDMRELIDVKKKMNEMSRVPKDLTTSDTSDTKLDDIITDIEQDIKDQDNPTEKEFHKPVQQPTTIFTKLKDKLKIKLGRTK